ncbi:MAG: amidohydrolase family protein [Bacteroidales bacterium]|jgi:predicted TIM-barrel fold metal-dependent hydrolase|nr:amidohydrolase family protein [Bacteroidales bacterium]
MRPFFDIHCHLMTFDEPDFVSFLKQIGDNISKEALHSMLSPDYLLDFKNKHMQTKVSNLINVMSHSQKEIAELMENDLRGKYLINDAVPFIKADTFHFANQEFDKYVICPMVMDFTSRTSLDDIYYKSRSDKDAFMYADKMLASIRSFYQANKGTVLEILPFAGINPPAYTIAEVERWLKTYFKGYRPSERYQHKRRPRFFGIKLYPPLGFNPIPEEAVEKAKVELIFAYAEKHAIPITTHCDDGGYRTTDVETSHSYTSPEAWASVLAKYPHLKLNFAHFGRQYQRTHFMRKQDKWRNSIIDLILKYDNVYTDLSFNGLSPEYYDDLLEKLKSLKATERCTLHKRIMFGSDFMINLSKVVSYYEYLKIFENSALLTEEKMAYASTNCRDFLFQ